ncbi:hypothetical protein [Pelagibius sp.]|uniref:hypothetical protein n=1 Tax=Pelagibius sp. TaxID=1931238 RepID=UPI0026366740|nr:hypothetical protein [Pelagibius sp.]
MRRLRRVAALMFVAASSWPFQTLAQTADESAWQTLHMLNGRLLVSAPGNSIDETVGADSIMAAAPAEGSISRIRIPLADTEIVVQARELYALFPSDPETFFRNVVLGSEQPVGDVTPYSIDLSLPLKAYGIGKGSYRHPSGDYVLANVLIAQSDGSAQHLQIMTWEKPPEVVARAEAIAERIVFSLRAGPRQELPRGGTHTLVKVKQSDGELADLTLTIPKEYTFSKEQGPDFVVFRIGRLVPLDATTGSFGVYVGNFPSYHFSHKGIPLEKLRRTPTKILGHHTEWLERFEPPLPGSPGWVHREVILRPDSLSDGLALHIFISAPEDGSELAELTKTAESGIQISKR